MEFSEELSRLCECETFPILTVKDGIVTNINVYGSELNITTGTPIKSVIYGGLTDYERFSNGVLFLSLCLNDTIQNAVVVRRDKEDIFILESKHTGALVNQANNIRKQLQKSLNDAMIGLDILASNSELKENVYFQDMTKSLFQLLKQAADIRAEIEYTNNSANLLPNQEITEFLAAYLEASKPKVEGAGFKLKYTLPQKQVFCSVDYDGIKFAIANMISTAIKYGKRNRTLNLKMVNHPNYCTITVSNLLKDNAQFKRFCKDNVFPVNPFLEDSHDSLYSSFRTLRAIANRHKGSVHFDCIDGKTLKITLSIPAGIKLFNGNIKKLHTYIPAQLIHSGGHDPMLIALSDILPSKFYA